MAQNVDVRKVMEELDKKDNWTAEDLDRAVASATREEDPYGFEFETMSDFSDAPLDFEEYTLSLMDDLDGIYYLTGTYNRFSPAYIGMCELMEKVIKLLGRCCLTKAVLEKKGFTFKNLNQLSIEMLYRCISFNFRKCHAAVTEGRKKKILDINLLNRECSLFLLAERLKTTADKIEKIRSGKISIDAMLERSTVFKSKQGSEASSPRMNFPDRKPASMPILGSVAREMIRERKAEEKALETNIFKPEVFKPMKLPPEWMTEEEKAIAEKKSHRSKTEIRREEAEKRSFEREFERSTAEFWEAMTGKKCPERDDAAKTAPDQGERKPLSYHPVMKKKKPKKKR